MKPLVMVHLDSNLHVQGLFITLQYARTGILSFKRNINFPISDERQTTPIQLLLFKIQYRTMFLVLHTLPVVAYWIIYREKANFVLHRKKIHYVQGMRISFTLGN